MKDSLAAPPPLFPPVAVPAPDAARRRSASAGAAHHPGCSLRPRGRDRTGIPCISRTTNGSVLEGWATMVAVPIVDVAELCVFRGGGGVTMVWLPFLSQFISTSAFLSGFFSGFQDQSTHGGDDG